MDTSITTLKKTQFNEILLGMKKSERDRRKKDRGWEKRKRESKIKREKVKGG